MAWVCPSCSVIIRGCSLGVAEWEGTCLKNRSFHRGVVGHGSRCSAVSRRSLGLGGTGQVSTDPYDCNFHGAMAGIAPLQVWYYQQGIKSVGEESSSRQGFGRHLLAGSWPPWMHGAWHWQQIFSGEGVAENSGRCAVCWHLSTGS